MFWAQKRDVDSDGPSSGERKLPGTPKANLPPSGDGGGIPTLRPLPPFYGPCVEMFGEEAPPTSGCYRDLDKTVRMSVRGQNAPIHATAKRRFSKKNKNKNKNVTLVHKTRKTRMKERRVERRGLDSMPRERETQRLTIVRGGAGKHERVTRYDPTRQRNTFDKPSNRGCLRHHTQECGSG